MAVDFATQDNIEKAKSGRNFESEVKRLLVMAEKNKVIDAFRHMPIYTGCFRPNFEIRKGNKIVLVDATTTARTDRFKGKLWDAYFTKKILTQQARPRKKISVSSYIVVQKTDGKERNAFLRGKKYVQRCSKPFGAADDVLSVEEFLRMLINL